MGQRSKHYNLLGERKDIKHIYSGNRQKISDVALYKYKPSKVNYLWSIRGIYSKNIY